MKSSVSNTPVGFCQELILIHLLSAQQAISGPELHGAHRDSCHWMDCCHFGNHN